MLAPIEQLIPMAPSPAISKKFVNIIRVNTSVMESKLIKGKSLVRYKTVRYMIYTQIYEAEVIKQALKNRNPNIQNSWIPYFGRIFSL